MSEQEMPHVSSVGMRALRDTVDADYFLYGVGSIGTRYQITNHIQAVMQINNILDKHYSTAAQLGTTPFDNNDRFVAQPFGTPYGPDNVPIRSSSFQAPGTPFNIYGGLKFTFLKQK